MRLILVRHGQTSSNVNHLLDTMPPGAELNDNGRSQAEELVGRLADESIEAVYASDIPRAGQTVAPLAAAHGLEVELLPGLREIPAGEDEMSADLTRYIEILIEWAKGNKVLRHPGGESGEEFLSRFDEAVGAIADRGHGTAVAVSHGGALRMWTGYRLLNRTPEESLRAGLGNATVIVLEGDPKSGWTLVSWDSPYAREWKAGAESARSWARTPDS